MRNRNKELLKARANRMRLGELKLQRGCMDCGYNESAYALEFDHRDNPGLPYTGRSKTVAARCYGSWTSVLKEVEKCDVVCANCHAIRTALRRGYTW